jgi:hypothetical protein
VKSVVARYLSSVRGWGEYADEREIGESMSRWYVPIREVVGDIRLERKDGM